MVCKNYPNIVALQKENGGVADTRNVGIKAAKGKYIAFMDNDDLIRSDMISSLYKSIEKITVTLQLLHYTELQIMAAPFIANSLLWKIFHMT